MSVPFKDVSASSLCLNLVSGHVDVSTLHPISETGLILTIGGVAMKIELGILGASHFMSLASISGNRALTEVVACAGVGATDQRLYFGPLGCKQIGPLTQSIFDGALTYTFSARTERWSEPAASTIGKLAHNIVRANQDSDRPTVGLTFEFPRSSTVHTDQQPMTLVYLETDPDRGIRLQTVHSYPNDSVVVVTESMLGKGDR
jgi:hypothetical protein